MQFHGCEFDEAFKEKYFNSLDSINNYNKNCDSKLLQSRSKSYDYIFSVTNIRGQHVNGYMGAYYQGDAKKKIHDDMSLWEQWYEENKCEMTLQKADSIYFKYISSNN